MSAVPVPLHDIDPVAQCISRRQGEGVFMEDAQILDERAHDRIPARAPPIVRAWAGNEGPQAYAAGKSCRRRYRCHSPGGRGIRERLPRSAARMLPGFEYHVSPGIR